MARPKRKLSLVPVSKLPDTATNLERAISELPDGRAIVLSYCRQIALTEDLYKTLIRDYDSDKTQDIGDLCNKHGIPHADFLARIVKEAYPIVDEMLNMSRVISTKIIAAKLPHVVNAGMDEGAKSDGVTDRHFTLQKEGFHVAPKGMSINVNQVNQQAAGLPNFEDETRGLADILSQPDERLLTEGDADYIDAEFEESKEELQTV